MAGTERLLAIAMAIFSVNIPRTGSLEAVGVVVGANHATLGAQAAKEGTTIYDGDRFATDAEGTLRLRVGDAVVDLRNGGSAVLRESGQGAAGEFAVELASGVATLSVSAARPGEIVAWGARVRPVSQVRGVVRVQVVGPNELLVYAQRGAAQVAYRDETETIAEGKTYRVLLNPTDEGAADRSPKPPSKRRKALLLIAVAAATAAGVALAVTSRHANAESPDRP
jgi:hypothetical protein